jgi:hypothetical protein
VPERGGDHAQGLVPGRVAVGLVHAREAVHVEHHEAERGAAAAGALELEVEGVLEAAPVRESGERVARGELREPFAGADQAVAQDGDHEAGEQQRPDRGDPAVDLGAAGVLEREHDRVRDRDEGHVHERRAQAEEVEDEDHDQQVRQRREGRGGAPRVGRRARERDAEHRHHVEAGHWKPVAGREQGERQSHGEDRGDHEQVLVPDRRVRGHGRDQAEGRPEQGKQRAGAGGARPHAGGFTPPSGLTQAESLA